MMTVIRCSAMQHRARPHVTVNCCFNPNHMTTQRSSHETLQAESHKKGGDGENGWQIERALYLPCISEHTPLVKRGFRFGELSCLSTGGTMSGDEPSLP